MALRSRHSKEFQEALVKKILNRGERSVASVCEEAGVIFSTADNWLRKYAMMGTKLKSGVRMKWTPEAKLKAVSETLNLAENDLGAYLRKEGLYSNQIAEWRAEIVKYFETKPKFAKDESDLPPKKWTYF